MSKHITLENLNVALPPIKHLIDKKAEGVDWNENDPGASGYIRNRPFYESVEETTVEVAQETTVTIDEGGASISLTESLIEGQTYTVTWNGTSYECIGRNYDGYIMIGNHAIYEYDNGIETDTGEPFAIEEGGTRNAWIYVESGTTVTLSISYKGIVKKIKKIDEKYLPEIGEGASIGIKGTGNYAEVFNNESEERYRASGDYSHAEGDGTEANGDCSHAEGRYTIANGVFSHAEGVLTIASSYAQHVQGVMNIEDANQKYLHIVGNGTAGAQTIRSNAHTLDRDGVGWFAGGLKVGGTGQDDTAAVEVATKTDTAALSALIGDTPVATQIANAMTNVSVTAITDAEIDAICGTLITSGEEVEL